MSISIADIIAIVTAFSALISAVAAARWGQGLAAAKEEIIKAKDAQIESLRLSQEQMLKVKEAQIETLHYEINSYKELTPNKIREYFISMKEQLEEYNEILKLDLQKAQRVIDEKDLQIEKFSVENLAIADELERLNAKREQIVRKKSELNQELEHLQYEKLDTKDDFLGDADLGLALLRRMKEMKLLDIESELLQEQQRKLLYSVCPRCGRTQKLGAKFCASCGTNLEVFVKTDK